MLTKEDKINIFNNLFNIINDNKTLQENRIKAIMTVIELDRNEKINSFIQSFKATVF